MTNPIPCVLFANRTEEGQIYATLLLRLCEFVAPPQRKAKLSDYKLEIQIMFFAIGLQ